MARHAPLVALLCCLAAAASAEVKSYTLRGDVSTLLPTDGTTLRPRNVFGNVVIDDAGTGTPTLDEFTLVIDWSDVLIRGPNGGAGIPGSTAILRSVHELSTAPGQSGTGSTTSSISWGTLTGWTQTGFLRCDTVCPDGPCPPGVGICATFVGFEGLGPPPPIASDSFDTGPWAFSGAGLGFDTDALEFVNLAGGLVTHHAIWSGALTEVPLLPVGALATLGLTLMAWGVARLRRG